MNTDRDRLLNEYLDGALSEDERRRVEETVSLDPSAARELAELQRLGALARQLPPSLEPSRDLWPDIAGRLQTMPRIQPVRRRPWRTALVAAMLAGAFIGGVLAARMWPGESGGAGFDTAAAPQGGVVFAEFQAARSEYAEARTTLLASLEMNRESLSPETRAVIDDNLAVINQAVADIEHALASDPSNRNLMELLVAAYDDEVGLLRQAVALPREI